MNVPLKFQLRGFSHTGFMDAVYLTTEYYQPTALHNYVHIIRSMF